MKISKAFLEAFITEYNDLSKRRARIKALIHEAGFEPGVDYDLEVVAEKDPKFDFSPSIFWWELRPKGEETE